MSVPVIDLFAGPGGLGEGFSREDSVQFDIAISIEKDGMAHETLRLRAAHRALTREGATEETWQEWDSILASEPWNVVFSHLQRSGNRSIEKACAAADHEALEFELGPESRDRTSAEIRKRLAPFMKGGVLPGNSVLIGGPPCQAYSVVGRSRNRGTEGYKPEDDHRHFLYREYLHVIAEFQPAVFVMENVKGILSSRVDEGRIFHTIMNDLRRPDVAAGTAEAVEYVLLPLAGRGHADEHAPEAFIVKAEEFGIPQARHRVIILGVRKDVFDLVPEVGRLVPAQAPSVEAVIFDLPALRPQLSHRGKGLAWQDALEDPLLDRAVAELRSTRDEGSIRIADRLEEVRAKLRQRKSDPGFGGDRARIPAAAKDRRPKQLADWIKDRPTDLLANHESRAHMPTDLVRYLFVAAYGEITEMSPRLMDFPKCLLPEHKNVDPENIGDSIFKDRFRVQVGSRHSMTVTSHIAKDGHAFIHPKAMQCRSLSVREAARLQTFPDTYVFLGNRTSQYTQVGNAVPPYLARQIAGIVAEVLKAARLA
ncbi:MAG: DNA cytosine methyltransferase [Pelomonas sp.]|nr:DNA cytosine methyltransferase [Roseateles sp.]